MRYRPSKLSLVLAVVGLLAAACLPGRGPAASSGGAGGSVLVSPPDAAASASPDVTVPAGSDPAGLPLAWFVDRRSDPDTVLLGQAFDALVARCMEEHGFEVEPPPDEANLSQGLAYWYGLTDPDEARSDGYTRFDASARASVALDTETPEGDELPASVPPERAAAYLVSLYGREEESVSRQIVDPITGETAGIVTADGGCVGEAEQAIFGGVDRYLEFESTRRWLAAKVWDIRLAAENTETVREAARGWLSCMSEAGFPPDHRYWPGEVATAEGTPLLGGIPSIGADWRNLPEPRPSSEEVEMAVADVECKSESGWTRAIFTEEYQLQDELAAAAAEFIGQGRTARSSAVDRARQVLAGG